MKDSKPRAVPVTDPIEKWERCLAGKHYWISSFGRIYSDKSRIFLSPRTAKNGYLRICLYGEKGKKSYFSIHRLVLFAFTGLAPAGHEAAHLDGIRSNNQISNLIWATRKENHQHKRLHGTYQVGSKANNSLLTEDLVRRIRTEPASDKIWAERLGICWQTIKRARQGETWGHVDAAPLKMPLHTRIRDIHAKS